MTVIKRAKEVSFIDTGITEWGVINKNFVDISNDIDELVKRIEFNSNRPIANLSVTHLLESEGYTTILTAKEHSNKNMKLVHGFVQAGDNVKENVTVHVLRENRDLCDAVTIKGTEKSGKAQSFEPYIIQIVGKMEAVKLYSNSRRKVIVTLVFSFDGVKQ